MQLVTRRNNKPWWSFWSQCHGRFLRLLVQCHIGVNELQLDDWVGRQSSPPCATKIQLTGSAASVVNLWSIGLWDKLFVFVMQHLVAILGYLFSVGGSVYSDAICFLLAWGTSASPAHQQSIGERHERQTISIGAVACAETSLLSNTQHATPREGHIFAPLLCCTVSSMALAQPPSQLLVHMCKPEAFRATWIQLGELQYQSFNLTSYIKYNIV